MYLKLYLKRRVSLFDLPAWQVGKITMACEVVERVEVRVGRGEMKLKIEGRWVRDTGVYSAM